MSNKIVVTGGYGFVGSYLTNLLLSQGFEVLVVDNFSTGSKPFVPEHPLLTTLEADITQGGAWMTAFRAFAPDIVFHLAAIHFIPYCNAHWAETLGVNLVGLQNVLECSTGAQGVVFASTAAVYAIGDRPHQETEVLGPTDIYGVSKKAGEDILSLWSATRGVPARAARLFNVFGPNETNPHLIPEVMYQADCANEINLGNVDTKRDYVFVGDIASGLICLMRSMADGPRFDAYNIGTGCEYSAREVVSLLGESLDRPLVAVPRPERFRPSDRPHLSADNAKLRSLGWQPAASLHDGLRVTWSHFQTAGFLKPY